MLNILNSIKLTFSHQVKKLQIIRVLYTKYDLNKEITKIFRSIL